MPFALATVEKQGEEEEEEGEEEEEEEEEEKEQPSNDKGERARSEKKILFLSKGEAKFLRFILCRSLPSTIYDIDACRRQRNP